ncbi:MAG: hypothetical protein IJ274_01750 [Lachnospiraceae bacterium]|nr:hypothetical protein [Lachnospiraceae bacterium]
MIWSDNDVKASFTYEVKNPKEVKDYLESLFDNERAVNETFSAESSTTELSTIEEAVQFTEAHELTMEELIELSQEGTKTLAEVMQRIPLEEEGMVYTNLEKDKNDYEGFLNWNYFCYLSYEGKDYRLQLSYRKEDNSLLGIYLYHPASDDSTSLYTNRPERYTVNNDIQEFLDREYNIEDYFTCTLPKGTRLGNYKIYYNDVFSGCPILGDYEEPAHGDGAPEAWYTPGGVVIGANDENNDRMQFENGKVVSVRWWGNHVWIEEDTQEYLEGCDMQAILCEVNFHLFVAAEIEEYMQEHNLSEGDMQVVSKYWYVFMGEEDSEYVYIVYLNQEYFTKEDVIELARSVEITQE